MRYMLLIVLPSVMAMGCVKTSAVTDTAVGIRERVTPAAREIAAGSRRLVRAAGQAADNAALAARVNGVLEIRRDLKSQAIKVSAEEGVVTLTGRVPSRAQKRVAGEVAGTTVGVRRVVNRLKVGERADAGISSRVSGGGG